MSEHEDTVRKFKEALVKASMLLDGKTFTKEETNKLLKATHTLFERVSITSALATEE